ncbi:MAG: hypothetical protein KF799_09910 [Bdellovibrionales bacterium]|nr:hypothetical protein [Bdellovibrionales bacterium]
MMIVQKIDEKKTPLQAPGKPAPVTDIPKDEGEREPEHEKLRGWDEESE